MNELDKIIAGAEKQVKGILQNKKLTSTGLGAAAGYLLTKDSGRKNTNAIIGGVIGYILGSDGSIKEDLDEDEEDENDD